MYTNQKIISRVRLERPKFLLLVDDSKLTHFSSSKSPCTASLVLMMLNDVFLTPTDFHSVYFFKRVRYRFTFSCFTSNSIYYFSLPLSLSLSLSLSHTLSLSIVDNLENIIREDKYKCLGVTLDETLFLDKHIQDISKKVSNALGPMSPNQRSSSYIIQLYFPTLTTAALFGDA